MWIHASGIAVLLRGLMKLDVLSPTSAWPIIRLLLRMIWWLILIHLTENSVWAFAILASLKKLDDQRPIGRAELARSVLYY